MSKASDLARLMTSGSTAIHGEAGVTSSGSTGLTTNLQQGLSKHWVNLDGDASGVGARDSFNSSSTTDNGTGNYDSSYTNAMSNANYMVCGTGAHDAPISSNRDRIFQAVSESTALMNINFFDDSAQRDQNFTYGASFGDLA